MKSGLSWLAAVTIVATAACGGREPNYEEAANKALDTAALDAVDADYDNSAKTIHLTGTVTSETDRQRAGDVVQKAVGTGAQVANEVTVAGLNEEIADDLDSGIENRLEDIVNADPNLKDDDLSFDANNGVVTITGTVSTKAESDQVGELAKSQPGVREVVNTLTLKPAR